MGIKMEKLFVDIIMMQIIMLLYLRRIIFSLRKPVETSIHKDKT